jgi:hypothetical protein
MRLRAWLGDCERVNADGTLGALSLISRGALVTTPERSGAGRRKGLREGRGRANSASSGAWCFRKRCQAKPDRPVAAPRDRVVGRRHVRCDGT